ncbi:uncharacterized protein Z519_03159 [Cladophialophora bantiana CBS 173.52]|uniref:LEM-like domain-containing protein n=1 Tax=Cladophialophora bantiana (strain ATCC 10958 / CBS 173.52 / CDC B-1940 / NIH 8579) TaxID=1442370 RepID=A0A0D2GC78_CLAB1|nr:uncharacterized protein Z519_03159 [Cladophialophora bantiana CBS 173.52]KIW96092.1 hypothetical protein Z519_03159 [Cladophialophora bantiana CBS 173.52]
MAEEDDLYYLQSGFDLNSLTIPRIRSILVAQNVHYPSSAKKGQLLEILEKEILPRREKLLRAQARVRRTSKGITDVPSCQAETIDGDQDDDRQLMPPPPPPKTPRSRKSKSDLNAGNTATPAPSTSKRTKTPSRRSTTRTPRVSDTEPEAEKTTIRRPRKSAPSEPVLEPSVKIEAPDGKSKRKSLEAAEASPFSDDNPFQSGSSSPSISHHRKSSTSRTRKSLTSSSTTKRGQTISPPIKSEEFTPSRSELLFPVSRISSADAEDGVAVTEEFTPDAARELAEEERNGQLMPSRTSTLVRRKKKKEPNAVVKNAPLAIMTTVLAALGAWYRREKINIGYCGVGEPNWSLASNPHIPAWVHENFQPKCEPCPQHAVCYPNMEVECESDFVLKPHPLSLGGLIPLPPTCEPDSEKQRRIKAVADRAIEELRERRAAYECGGDITSSSSPVSRETEAVKTVAKSTAPKLEVAEEDLKQTVSKMRRKGMTEQEFEELWRGALGDIKARDEVEVTQDRSGRTLLSSSSLARLPFACAVRRSLLRAFTENRIPIAILILIASASVYGRHRIISYQQATAQIPGLVATTLDRLATQAALNQDARASEPFISAGQLRDDVLRNVFSASERERVWQNVRKIVEGNSNVRASTREGGKTGEWSRVWEWIGPLDLAPGLEGRRSGGMITDARTAEGSSRGDGVGKVENESNVGVRRWDEGRPIY